MLNEEDVLFCAEFAGARLHKSGRITVADEGISGAGAQFVRRFADELQSEIQKKYPKAHIQAHFESDDAYWRYAMANRMPVEDEVARLTSVLYGFYARNMDVYGSVIEFALGSSRPYGNKYIPESIAFNLGWDFQRVLTTEHMPSWVEEEAKLVHNSVLANMLLEEKEKRDAG